MQPKRKKNKSSNSIAVAHQKRGPAGSGPHKGRKDESRKKHGKNREFYEDFHGSQSDSDSGNDQGG